MTETGNQHINVRTRAIIFNEDDELLVEHGLTPRTDFHNLPGGGVKFREKLEDCVTREIKEETGLEVEVERLLWVRDFLDQFPSHSIEVFFLATIVGGKFMPTHHTEAVEYSFVAIEELEEIAFYPKSLIAKLKHLRDNRDWVEENPYTSDQQTSGRYL